LAVLRSLLVRCTFAAREVDGVNGLLKRLRRWWWPPLVVLGGLLGKSWLVGNWLSGVAREEAAEVAGIPVERVEADGLDIHLTGFESEEELEAAVAAVDALDSSWEVTGEMMDPSEAGTDAESVAGPEQTDPADGATGDGEAGDGDAAAASTTAGVTTSTTEAVVTSATASDETASSEGSGSEDPGTGDSVAPELDPAAVSVEANVDGTIVLGGTVADDDVRAALMAQAKEVYGDTGVIDALTLGEVESDGGVLTITGEAASDEQKTTWVEGAAAIAESAGLELADEVTVAAASEQPLAALLELEPVEFGYLSWFVPTRSLSTLGEAAELIKANPEAGRIRIIGFTDSDGSDAKNVDLSLKRAQIVVDYLVTVGGVDADRLEVDGRGETDLKVEPELTAEDKQRNRRIEWELLG
jgi:outer membrane protein OmpA-like peptidoglycan-associated protein